SSLGRLPTTSATPPSLTKGTASVLTIRILKRVSFMVQPSCKGGSTARSLFSLLSYHAKQNLVLPRRGGGCWDEGWGRLCHPGRGMRSGMERRICLLVSS